MLNGSIRTILSKTEANIRSLGLSARWIEKRILFLYRKFVHPKVQLFLRFFQFLINSCVNTFVSTPSRCYCFLAAELARVKNVALENQRVYKFYRSVNILVLRPLRKRLVRVRRFFNGWILKRCLARLFRYFKRFVRIALVKTVFSSSRIKNFLFGNSYFAKFFLGGIKDLAWKTDNAILINYSAKIFQLRKEYEEAFDAYFYLFKKYKRFGYCSRAIVCELNIEKRPLYEYYLLNKDSFSPEVFHFMACEYAQYFDDVDIDWNTIRGLVQENFFPPLVNKSLLAALAVNNHEYISWVESVALSRISKYNKEEFRRTLTIVAACYYRTGRSVDLVGLGEKINYNNYDWQLYMSFGRGDIMTAMDYRGKLIKNSFFLYYRANRFFYDKKVLVPEKDLCGEAFNSLFYDSVFKDVGSFSVICDKRLFRTLKLTFNNVNFIPKSPRYLQKTNHELFDMLHFNLDNYLDNHSYRNTLGSKFIPIDYVKYYGQSQCRASRKNGWLKPDPELKSYWKRYLDIETSAHMIGFSSNSTVRSKIRDMHMVAIDYWDGIFTLPNCTFVNLNAGFSSSECEKLTNKYGVKIINPVFDLYNDFDNLLALMSVLDYGILPANNLMDFAAAIGLKTVIFSPSNIMKVWSVGSSNEYVFSENVRFVFPDHGHDNFKLVADGVAIIKKDLDIKDTREVV